MRILLLDKNHPLITEQLLAKNFILEEDFTSSYDEVCGKIQNYDGVIIRSRIPLDKNFLEKASNLKFIARVGAGMENIDIPVAEKLGIQLINSPEGNRDSVAEHVVGMLLILMNRLFIASNEVKKEFGCVKKTVVMNYWGKLLVLSVMETWEKLLQKDFQVLDVQ